MGVGEGGLENISSQPEYHSLSFSRDYYTCPPLLHLYHGLVITRMDTNLLFSEGLVGWGADADKGGKDVDLTDFEFKAVLRWEKSVNSNANTRK
jgi:hypothetical protein